MALGVSGLLAGFAFCSFASDVPRLCLLLGLQMHFKTRLCPSDLLTRSFYQALLGQITEMIHVASLIHDDVLDEADTRRGGESVHKLYSNKVRRCLDCRCIARNQQ